MRDITTLRSLSRFALVGAGNTALGLGIIFTARTVLPDTAANLLCYILLVPLSFLAHRRVSFRHGGPPLPAFLRYLPTVLLGYLANLAVLTGLLATRLDPHLAQIGAIAAYVGITYLLSRHWCFRPVSPEKGS